jgi:hypothetical protein
MLSLVDKPVASVPSNHQPLVASIEQQEMQGTLFSFACVLPGHRCICRTLSDPVATLQ